MGLYRTGRIRRKRHGFFCRSAICRHMLSRGRGSLYRRLPLEPCAPAPGDRSRPGILREGHRAPPRARPGGSGGEPPARELRRSAGPRGIEAGGVPRQPRPGPTDRGSTASGSGLRAGMRRVEWPPTSSSANGSPAPRTTRAYPALPGAPAAFRPTRNQSETGDRASEAILQAAAFPKCPRNNRKRPASPSRGRRAGERRPRWAQVPAPRPARYAAQASMTSRLRSSRSERA